MLVGPQGPPGPPGDPGSNPTPDVVNTLNKQIKDLRTKLAQEQKGGATYTRWGRTTCGSDATLVYRGKVGGRYSSQHGGGANYVCLHESPEWGNFSTTDQRDAYVYAAEYAQLDRHNLFETTNAQSLNGRFVPCAVCHSVKRTATIMTPGRLSCEKGWTMEYNGLLVSGYAISRASYVFECLDLAPETTKGSRTSYSARMYAVQVYCRQGSLCPDYVHFRELTCVVCTK